MVWLKRDTLNRAAQTLAAGPPQAPLPAPVRPAEVIDRLRKLVEDGRFPPGSRLPAERALAAQLGVGRPSLREAIKALSSLQVLESRRGAGTFVKSREALAPPSDFGVLDLLEVRKIIEPRAAWLAATRASERHLLEIETTRQQLEQHGQDWLPTAKLDYALHFAIIRGAQNPVLHHIYRHFMSNIFANRSLTGRSTLHLERMNQDHRAIVEAILKRQADAAEKAMTEHLNSVGLDFISEATR